MIKDAAGRINQWICSRAEVRHHPVGLYIYVRDAESRNTCIARARTDETTTKAGKVCKNVEDDSRAMEERRGFFGGPLSTENEDPELVNFDPRGRSTERSHLTGATGNPVV